MHLTSALSQRHEGGPKLYAELASWFPLLSPPSEYAEEAEFYRRTLVDACVVAPASAGVGERSWEQRLAPRAALPAHANEPIARHARRQQASHPEYDHAEGDMSTLRLEREFDCVLIHDAVCYMTAEKDLRRAIETAFVHCRRGGAALFAPDHVRETFRPSTDHGGSDGDRRSLRYLEWTWDPNPDDTTYTVDFAYLLRTEDGQTTAEHDRHIEGLFSCELWLGLLADVGFRAERLPFDHSDLESGELEVFVGRRT